LIATLVGTLGLVTVPHFAEMDVDPIVRPSARPLDEMDAMLPSVTVQSNDVHVPCDPSEYVTAAESCCVPPRIRETEGDEIATDTGGGGPTGAITLIRIAFDPTPPQFAVASALPADIPFAIPADTDATPGTLLVHTAEEHMAVDLSE